MKLAIMGTGYVGLTSGVCFASKGHDVSCVDVNPEKIRMINSKTSPIYEEGMSELLSKVIDDKKLVATLDAESAIKDAEVVFICVGTPSLSDGSINLDYIKSAAKIIADNLNDYQSVAVETVIPRTTETLLRDIRKIRQGVGVRRI